mgnify:CR=1 FL=1
MPTFAKPLPKIIIDSQNQASFYEVLPTQGKVITCYVKNGIKYAGKKSSVVLSGGLSNIWKDDKIKLNKIAKTKGKLSNAFKKEKKKNKINLKLCKDNNPPVVTPTPTPTPTPVPPTTFQCGNGLLEGAEICDDGNSISGDGCSSLCLNENCGDNVLQPLLGEECDDGNLVSGDNCSVSCSVEGTTVPPGSGFSGPTTEPGPVGNPASSGYGAKVIAHWNTVPFQTFYDEMNIGVVAFHMNGIDRVEFAVNGGAWTAVDTKTENPETSTVEYWVKIKASQLTDGRVEIRAIAYPSIGQPRLLESLFLNANKNLTLPDNVRYVSMGGNDVTGNGTSTAPYLTIMKAVNSLQVANGGANADGGSVYLESGNYTFGTHIQALNTTTVNRWITVRPRPGLSKATVLLTAKAADGLNTKLVHLEDLTIKVELESNIALTDYLWIENCKVKGNGPDTVPDDMGDGFVSGSSGWSEFYITDSIVTATKNGLPAKIVRNVAMDHLGSDAFSGARLVVNSSVDDIDAGDTIFNPNFIRFDLSSGDVENRIYYGVSGLNVTAPGFVVVGDGVKSLNNVAFVNVLFDYRPSSMITFSEWTDVISSHILFWHITSTQQFSWSTDKNNLSAISMKNNSWEGFTAFGAAADDVLDQQDVNYNHFVTNAVGINFAPGTNVSTGVAGYNNMTLDDFTPSVSAAIKNRSTVSVIPIDIDGNSRSIPVSLGAYE